jgi:hypothetical protein
MTQYFSSAIIALREYKISSDKSLLQQVNDELKEFDRYVD